MTRDVDDAGRPANGDAAIAARHNWIADQLGEQWRSEGDGVYRFVGPSETSRAARPVERAHDDATETQTLLPWLEPSDADRTPSQRPRPSHFPWRRR